MSLFDDEDVELLIVEILFADVDEPLVDDEEEEQGETWGEIVDLW